MRHRITEAEYDRAYEGDLREMFEVLANSSYLDVLNTQNDDGDHIIGTVVTATGQNYFCNMSEVYAYDMTTKRYHFQRAVESGDATETFFRYDTLDDARAHAVELLAVVTPGI